MDRAALEPRRGPFLFRVSVCLGAVLLTATPALSVPGALAEEGVPSRDEYVGRVEPICKQNTEASERILRGVRGKVKRGQLPAAGQQLIRASDSFEKTIERIVALPRPAADAPRLVRWFGALRIVKENLRRIGVALEEGKRVKANHDAIRTERSGNAANNIGFVFEFHYCHFEATRLT